MNDPPTQHRFSGGRPIPLVLMVCLCVYWPAGVLAQPPGEPLIVTFGVVPQQAASKLAQLWTPVLNYLGEKTGYAMHFKTAPNIPTFEQRLARGEYDMAYMNPYHYTVFHRTPGYVAFAKEKDKRIKGIIVIRRDSPYRDLAELKGRTLAFPSPAAFAASVLTRAYFKKTGIPITPRYVSSHDSVYRTVARGLYPAGGGVMRTFQNMDPTISGQLRILWTTELYTPHAIAAHPRVPAEVIARVRQAMLAMHQEPRGQELLQAIHFKGIAAASDAEWNDVRGLGVDLLDTLTTHHQSLIY